MTRNDLLIDLVPHRHYRFAACRRFPRHQTIQFALWPLLCQKSRADKDNPQRALAQASVDRAAEAVAQGQGGLVEPYRYAALTEQLRQWSGDGILVLTA